MIQYESIEAITGRADLADPESVRARLAQPWSHVVVDGQVSTLGCPLCGALVMSHGPRLSDSDLPESAKSLHVGHHLAVAGFYRRLDALLRVP